MRLEIKHIAPYLPYGLECRKGRGNTGWVITGTLLDQVHLMYKGENYTSNVVHCVDLSEIKPLLKPLSELVNDNETMERLEAIEKRDLIISIKYKDVLESEGHYLLDNISYKNLQVLLSQNYDVFGLIDNGLAEVLCD